MNICRDCKYYKPEEYNPQGWEGIEDKPESEGVCKKLSKATGAGIILTPEYPTVYVTDNFGCIHFKK